ncbi:hypothetical protein OC835_007105 [Tilletia horrida]|nr:hypothetical protein OC835_007105 [Tilletia horrida]
MAYRDAADAAADAVRDAGASALSQLKPDTHTLVLLSQVLHTAAEPHLLNYLAYPLGLVALALFLLRFSVFAPARAKNDTADRGVVRIYAALSVAAAGLSAVYFIKNSIWSFQEFEDRAHLVASLISPLPSPADHPHPLVLLGAHIQRSIDWLYDSQPITEALKALAAHEGIWWWTAERLVLLSGAWLVLLQAEGHRLAIPYRPLYAIIALLGPISLAQALFFLALVTRAVPDGTLSNSADFILAADPKGGFHALSEASKHQVAIGGDGQVSDVTLQRTRTVTSTRSRLSRRGLQRTPSQLAMPPPPGAPLANEVLPNGEERGEKIIEEQQILQGELDLDPPYHVLSHLSLWITYWSAMLFLQRGRDALDVPHAREVYFQFALSVLAPFILPQVLRLPTSLPNRLAGTVEHLHNHLKDGWLFFALFAASLWFKGLSTLEAYRFLAQAAAGGHVPLTLLARFLLLGRPVVLQQHVQHHSPHGGKGLLGSLVPPAATFAVLDTYLAGLVTATWILYDRARLHRVGAFPASSATRWRMHAHLSVAVTVLLGPAAGLSLWAMQREALLSANEVRDERRLGRQLHLGERKSLELKHRVHVEQHKTRVIIQSDADGYDNGAALIPPTDQVPALATLPAAGHSHGLNGHSAGAGAGLVTGSIASTGMVPLPTGANGAGAGGPSASGSRVRTSNRASTRRQGTLSPGPSEGYAEEVPGTPRARRSTARTR